MLDSASFSLIFNAMPVPVLVLNANPPNFSIVAANAVYLKNNSFHENDVIGKSIFDIIISMFENEDTPSFPDLRNSLDKVMASNVPDKIILNRFNSTEKKYYEFENTPVFSENGEIKYISQTYANITERINAASRLESIQSRLKAAQQISKIGYWKLDLLQNELFWSDEVFNILGVNKNNSAPDYELFFQTIHPEDQDMFTTERIAGMSGEKKMDVEFRVVQENGVQKWIHERGGLVKNENGEAIAFEGTLQDITTVKLIKLTMEESNLRYYYASQATFDAIYDWDYINDSCYWGEGFTRDFGFDAETLSDKDFWKKHVHPDDLERVINEINQAAKGTGYKWVNDYRLQKMDGSYASVLDRSIIIRDKNGCAVRMIGAVQDITEKIGLQRLLDKANRLAQVGSWEINVENETVYWSDITKEIRETPENFEPSLRDGISYFREGHSKKTILARVKEAVKNGTPWQEDLQIYTHKGNLKWVRTIGQVEMTDGRCKKIYGSFQDIDQSKNAELEIIKLFEEKNTILESIGDGFFRVDNNWIVSYWNKEAEKMFSIPRKQILGKGLWSIFSDSNDSLSFLKYHESLETNSRIIFEDFFPVLKKWFEISAYPADNGLSVYFKDITARKLADLQLMESEKKYSELFRLNPQPTWVFESDTYRFVQVNKAAIDLYGYSEQEFLDLTLFDIRPPDEAQKFRKAFTNYKSEEINLNGQFTHQSKTGKKIEVEVQSNPIIMNDKKYHLVIITDITEKRQIQNELTRAIIRTQENERYEIGAELHDNICQILASSYITLGVLPKSENSERTELICQSREHIKLAISEIRNLSHNLAPAFFNNTTLEEACEILLSNANVEKKYDISLYFDKAINKMNICRELKLNLYRILQEQLRNIHKYAACKKIEVDLMMINHKIKLRIADDGVGFETNEKNTGIGISNMKRRVDLYNGEMEIFSSPGKGCELIINIPSNSFVE